MFEGARRSMSWLHTWSGLAVSWLLYFIFVTGTLGYFDNAIDRWMKPELPYQAELVRYPDAIAAAQGLLNQEASGATQWTLTLPEARNPYLHVAWQGKEARGEAEFDLQGRRIETRATGGGQWLYELHFRLHYLPIQWAYWIVCVCSMVMLVALMSGVIVHKRIFADFFTFRPRAGARSWLDLHNLVSISALPFHFMITYSGLLFLASTYLPLVFSAVYGDEVPAYEAFSDEFFGPSHVERSGARAPTVDLNLILEDAAARWGEDSVRLVTVFRPNDAASITRLIRMIGPDAWRSDRLYYESATGERLRVERPEGLARKTRMAMVNLHEGLFAGPLLRWLFFLSGVVSSAMIATGLVLWVKKRRRPNGPLDGPTAHWLIDRLNVATLLGVPLAIAVYFWANRLLPPGWDGRLQWEQHVFFGTLLVCAVYCALKPARTGSRHLLVAIVALFGLLPIACEAMGGSGLFSSIRRGDTTMLGFNLSLWATAVAAGAGLRYVGAVGRRERQPPGGGESRQ